MESTITFIIISLLFSAFFSAMETSFVSADSIRLVTKSNENGYLAKILKYFYAHQSQFLTTTLIGNTIALVIYGMYMAQLFDEPFRHLWGQYVISSSLLDVLTLLSQTIVSTIVVLFVAEFMPKTLALLRANNILEFFAIPMYILYFVIWIFSWFVIQTSWLLLEKVFGFTLDKNNKGVELADLNTYIRQASKAPKGEKDDDEADIDPHIFNNALKFKDGKVRDCMIPRTDIVAIKENQSIEELKKLFEESGHTKIIIYAENIDSATGYCHALQLFENPKDIKSITRKIITVPETTRISEMMSKFLKSHTSIAVVIDEFGGTEGLVTIEDIVEEVLGEIEDEHDDISAVPQCIHLSDGACQISGKYKVEDLLENENITIPVGDYDTLAGYILSYLGTIPEEGSSLEIDNFTIKIETLDGLRIDTVILRNKK